MNLQENRNAAGLTILALAIAGLIWGFQTTYSEVVLGELLSGWLKFLFNTIPQVRWRPDGVLFFAVGFLFTLACVHFFFSWLVREVSRKQNQNAKWGIRASFSLLSLVLMIFAIGISMSGIVHQTGWLLNSPEEMFVAKTQSESDSQLSLYDAKELQTEKPVGWISKMPYAAYYYHEPPLNSDQAWNSEDNRQIHSKVFPEVICPSQGYPIKTRDGFGISHIAGNPKVFEAPEHLRMNDFDDATNTALFGEVNAGFVPWGYPKSCRDLQLGIRSNWRDSKRGAIGYGSQHIGGAQFGMVDGSVTFISNGTDTDVLRRLSQVKK